VLPGLISAANAMNLFFNYEAAQSNCRACVSAAGETAEFMHATCAGVKIPCYSSSLVSSIVRVMLLDIYHESQDQILIVGVCMSRLSEK
jgi:hypothetical protein